MFDSQCDLTIIMHVWWFFDCLGFFFFKYNTDACKSSQVACNKKEIHVQGKHGTKVLVQSDFSVIMVYNLCARCMNDGS